MNSGVSQKKQLRLIVLLVIPLEAHLYLGNRMPRFSVDSMMSMTNRRAMVHVNTIGTARDELVIHRVRVRGKSSKVEKNRYMVSQKDGLIVRPCSIHDSSTNPKDERNTKAAVGMVAGVLMTASLLAVVQSANSAALRASRHTDAI